MTLYDFKATKADPVVPINPNHGRSFLELAGSLELFLGHSGEPKETKGSANTREHPRELFPFASRLTFGFI